VNDSLIGVDLACNDDRGNFASGVEAVSIGGLAQLEGDPIDCTDPTRSTVTIDGLTLKSHGYIPWHGNMAWDAIRVSLSDAARLITHLRARHWTIIEGDARLFAAYDSGEPITPELLQEGATNES
jgi:hypothetical protein